MSHALAYIHATEVGGTHPALVEAMGYGNCVVVNDTPENREVAADSGRYFDIGQPSTLSEHLQALSNAPESWEESGQRAAALASARYSWRVVSEEYAELFRELAGDAR